MKFSNTAPQHLANREVLDHFISLKQETDRLGEAIALKKARDSAAARKLYPLERDDPDKKDDSSLFEPLSAEKEVELKVAERRGLSDELVWIQNEVIKYLCSDLVPTSRQTPEGVAQLANELQDHQLTKAEVLQLCNLAPGEPVTLYSVSLYMSQKTNMPFNGLVQIIEEADTRFYPDASGKLDEIGNQIYNTLLTSPPDELLPYMPNQAGAVSNEEAYDPVYLDNADAEMEKMAMMQEEEFIHETGREGGVDDEQDGDMD
ncbi:hypothetical protein C345_00699 [Cryptococcus neoformans A2-102-5]|nr:hypothetical protein C353_00971 [Cryptococcus neoformans var. grubii AD1-83a]OXG67848.1 hypothetical protein C354_00976 [Cryptococcus neoformans var. grubii MW-RSA1955]OXG67889.1 hypothetical protein C351_00969 [Cryptococcus neoformans var. grubii c8]OXG71782.1 hypothetical protein C352_00972 [Cryptococcus neoformans var. grubii CHC193]OXG95233.1 hypothetical protein C346_00956 [Cryptococcus neoformans var. grubii D17-1]OXG99223.1 hypothetical protein C345_00699 [Cryptococcus neoformans var